MHGQVDQGVEQEAYEPGAYHALLPLPVLEVGETKGAGPRSQRRWSALQQSGCCERLTWGAASHAAYLARGDLVHPKLKGFGRGKVAFDLLHAHVDGDHEKMNCTPDLMLQQLVQVVFSPET